MLVTKRRFFKTIEAAEEFIQNGGKKVHRPQVYGYVSDGTTGWFDYRIQWQEMWKEYGIEIDEDEYPYCVVYKEAKERTA